MNGTVEKVSARSKEACEYFDILAGDPTFGFTQGVSKYILRLISALPTSEIYVFKNETQKVVGGILLSHFSTTAVTFGNLSNISTFINLHRNGYKYAGYLVVDEVERGKGYAELMWNIYKDFYIYMVNPKKEEKVIREGGEVILDSKGNRMYKGKSLYYKVSKKQK